MTQEEWRELGVEHDESYLVAAIRNHLLTETRRKDMFERNISVEDVLNGRTTQEHADFVLALFDEWNAALGWKAFGF